MQNDTGTEAVKSEEVAEDVAQETEQDTTDYRSLYEKAEADRKEEAARRKRAETALERKRLNDAVETKVEKVLSKKEQTGELDETQLELLEIRGITEDDDIAVIQKAVLREGLTVRQALKDEYVQGKLQANKAKRDLANATPSNTKRSGSQGHSVDALLARYEATGELPDDFALRSQVINAKIAKEDVTKPRWHRG